MKVLCKLMVGVRKGAEKGLQGSGEGCSQSARGMSGGLSGGGVPGGHGGGMGRSGDVGLFPGGARQGIRTERLGSALLIPTLSHCPHRGQ